MHSSDTRQEKEERQTRHGLRQEHNNFLVEISTQAIASGLPHLSWHQTHDSEKHIPHCVRLSGCSKDDRDLEGSSSCDVNIVTMYFPLTDELEKLGSAILQGSNSKLINQEV